MEDSRLINREIDMQDTVQDDSWVASELIYFVYHYIRDRLSLHEQEPKAPLACHLSHSY